MNGIFQDGNLPTGNLTIDPAYSSDRACDAICGL